MHVGEPGEGGGLVLVGHQQIGGGKEFGGQRLGRGRREDGPYAVVAGGQRAGEHGLQGQFELEEQGVGGADPGGVARLQGGDQGVGAGDDDDAVAALVVHGDVRGAAGALDGAQGRRPDPGAGERGAQPYAELVGPHRADHHHLRAAAGGGDGLVGALAAGDGAEVAAGDGLPEAGALAT